MTTHYKNGSEFPPLQKDVLRVYSMRFCPFAERTRLILTHKNIPFELINVSLKEKPDWFLDRTPMGATPVLEKNDTVIFDSTIINYYLDDVYPQNRIVPDDPLEKAKVQMLMEQFSKVQSSYFATIGIKPSETTDVGVNYKKFIDSLKPYEKALKAKFFGGETPGMVDFGIWPLFERFGVMKELKQKEALPKDTFPKLNEWVESMLQVEAVQKCAINTETHKRFLISYAAGTPEYDAIAA